MSATTHPPHPLARVFALRDFRLLFAGATTSMLGDQFALIATPWLTLQLTGNPLTLGVVLALEGIPRAVFMLLGGAVTDRVSPRALMLVSDLLRFVLTVLMTAAVLTGTVQLWMLYGFGLGFGLVAGFAIPAENSIVALLVREEDLQAGNSVMMGSNQLVGFIGPSLAGIIIGGFSNSLAGIGLAYGLDAASFAVSTAALVLMRGGGSMRGRPQPSDGGSVWSDIRNGIQFLWRDQVLRLMFLNLTAVNFLILGPLLVGIPVLADRVLPEGAVAFGLLMSAIAGGNLTGYLAAATLPRPNQKTIQTVLVLLLFGFGGVIGALGLIRSTSLDFLLLLFLSIGNGYVGILMITWFQRKTPKEMLGRMMSILMFSNLGLVPISQAISGAMIKLDLRLLFLSFGFLILLTTIATTLRPEFRTFTASLTSEDQPQEKVETCGYDVNPA